MRIGFLGAAGTVTGSKHLFESGGTRVLVDCGLFQGLKRLRRKNWDRLIDDPAGLDAVVLTHAHIDHSGWLPVLVRDGFGGPVYATPPTIELCGVLLRDAARLQEEDAAYANRKGFSKHRPARPLFTVEDAERALGRFEPMETGDRLEIGRFAITPQVAGHILGAVGIVIEDGERRAYVSGDLGRAEDPLMPPPLPPPAVDVLLMESTYGRRSHVGIDPVAAVAEALAPILQGGGVALVPSFAVGRTQNLLFCLHRAMRAGLLPRVPIHVDSPMATDVTELYLRFHDYHRLDRAGCQEICDGVDFVQDVAASKQLSAATGARIVIAGSGMLTGGRILHHLRAFAGDPRTGIVLPGYQAPGTRGADLAAGLGRVKIHGQMVEVRAQVRQLDALSAHADQGELLDWIASAPRPPATTYLVHGDPESADTLRRLIEERVRTEALVPELGDRVDSSGRPGNQ